MPPPSPFDRGDGSNSRAADFQISHEIDGAALGELFDVCFGEKADSERLERAHRLAVFSSDGRLLAGVAVELLDDDTGYLWLLAVSEANRGQGIGRTLLEAAVGWCRTQGCRAVRLKTYHRWQEMRQLLAQAGWAVLSADLSDRYDRVGETWQIPIVFERIPVVVIGGNPQGRGGEWANNIISAPQAWDLRAIVDPDHDVRAHWENLGVAAFPDIVSLPCPEEISAAVIAVPPSLSAKIQRSCFQQGWAVLVEKPLAASLSELVALQDDLTSCKARLVAGVQRRSHPSYVALKALLHGAVIRRLSIRIFLGRPLGDSLGGHRADSRLCRGGALIDLGYHALDLAHFLIGEPLEMVSCSLMDRGDVARGIESAADVLGRAGQTWVRIQVDRHGSSKSEEVVAETTAGTWMADREKVVSPENTVAFSCSGSWSLAEKGRLSDLAIACSGGATRPVDLWEHMSAFGIVEQAYGLASQLGVKGD